MAAAGSGDWEAAVSAFEERLGPLEDIVGEMQNRSLGELRSKVRLSFFAPAFPFLTVSKRSAAACG